jgi:thioredoxin reductase
MYEVIIVGAGPAGLSAAARAHRYGLDYVVLEQRQLANTLAQEYQAGKFVMALPAVIPLRSDLEFAAGSREDVLGTWANYAVQQQLNIRVNTPVTAISKKDGYFEVKTACGQTHTARYVVLAIGKLGNPRKLHAPGEQLTHVSYRLRDPGAFSGQDILVVGAGDSAAEVAVALSAQNRVALVNRKDKFYRMNEALQSQIEQKIRGKEQYLRQL